MDQERYQEELRKAKGLTPETPESEIKERLVRLRAGLKEDGIDAAFIFGSPIEPTWTRYYANYIYPFILDEALLFVSTNESEPILFIDQPWYVEPAKEMTGIRDVRVYPYIEFPWAQQGIAKVIGEISGDYDLAKARIGISFIDMPSLYYKAFKDAFPNAELVEVTHTLNRLAEHKSEYDMKMIRESAIIADQGMLAAIRTCREGATEYEVGLAAEAAMCAEGGEFGTGATVRTHIYVASTSTLLANVRGYKYTAKKLEKGDFFYIDLSSCYRGFYTDFCRTISIGQPSNEQQKMFDCTMATHEKMMQTLRPGVSGEELFRAGLQVAIQWGYRPDQINNVWLGHGTGLILSEPPFFQEGEKRQIKENTFVNIEPGIFIPQFGATSVEDQLFVHEGEVELVTQTPRELHVR